MNRVLKRIFGPEGDEVRGEWRKLSTEGFNYLCSLQNIVRVIKLKRLRWTGHIACMGKCNGVYRVLVGTPKETRPLGKPSRGRDDNIRMDHQELRCRHMDCFDMAQVRDRWRALVKAVMNFRVP